MKKYKILTDSSCDLTEEFLTKLNIEKINMKFTFDNTNYISSNEMDTEIFYEELKNGKVAKTSSLNLDEYSNFFEKYLKKGFDIIYIGLSSGLSKTVEIAEIAKRELSQKYQNSRIEVIDSLCASAGLGLLLYLCAENQKSGADFSGIIEFVKSTRYKISHQFTVDSLDYRKRGGRISPASAVLGELLGIKPMLYKNKDGKLETIGKVRGRNNAISSLAQKCADNADCKNYPVFISHGGCLKDAEILKKQIESKLKNIKINIFEISPFIGAHSGPGTLSVFYMQKN